jgi:outer membrane protein assembly factor BamB
VASDSGHVYLGLSDGKLDTLSPDGRKMWSADLGGTISSNLLPSGNSLILTTSPAGPNEQEKLDAVLRSLSKETGVTQWTAMLAPGDRHYLHAYNGWIIAASNSGSIRALDSNSGRLLWKREITAGFAGRPVFSGQTMVIAGISNQIFKISLTTGEIDGMVKHSHSISSILMASDGAVLTGDERGNIISLRIGSEKPAWRFKSGGQISTLMEIGSNLLAASHDNFVYLLEGGDGDVVWKRRLAGRLVYAARISAGYGLLSSLDDNGAVLIDLNSGRVVGQLTFAEDEKLSVEPVYSEGRIYVGTNVAAYSYSISGCGTNSEGGVTKK